MLAFLLGACSEQEGEAPQKTKRELTLPVQVGRVIFRDVADEIRGVGNLAAEQRVIITAEVVGRIRDITVEEGASVKADQVLARIDDREYRLEVGRLQAEQVSAQKELEKAQRGVRPEEHEKLEAKVQADRSALDLARKEFRRTEQLVKDGVVSQSNLDEASDRVRQAEETLRSSQAAMAAGTSSREEDILMVQSELESVTQRLALAKLNLAKTQIHAPFDGVVISKRIEVGAYAGSGTPLLEMIGSSRLKAVVEIPQGYRAKLDALEEIEFYLPDLGRRFKVGPDQPRQVRVIPDANIYSGNIKVQVDLPRPDPSLFPGLTLEALFRFKQRKGIKHVASEALVIGEKGTIVYIVKEGKAHLVPVRAFKERDGLVEVDDFTRQLTPQADLILRGSGAVFPGVRVMITNPEPKAEPPFNAADKGSSGGGEKPGT